MGLADQLDAAADAAANSPQALPMSPEAMRQMAQQARALADAMPENGDNGVNPELLKRSLN